MRWNLDNIKNAFRNMEQEGWNTNSRLKWEFTFFGKTRQALLNVHKELEDFDYTIEQLEYRTDLNLWIILVSKIEILGIEKLHRRNVAFEKLANYCGIESYDGWAVEQIKE